MPTATVIKAGPVRAAVSLVKTSSELKDAKWETRKVGADGEPLATAESEAQREREAAALGAWAEERGPIPVGDLPMGELEQEPAASADRVASAATIPPGEFEPHPVIPQSREQAIARDSALARNVAPVVETQRGVRVEGEFVDLTGSLKAIDEQAKIDGMEIVGAIPASIPRERIRCSYWISPQDDEAADTLRLLHHGLSEAKKGLAVRWTKRTNQAAGVIVADQRQGALLLLEVEFAEAMKKPPAKAKVAGDVTDRESQAVAKFVGSCEAKRADLDAVVDERRRLQAELLNATRAGENWQLPDPETFDAAVAELFAEAAAARS